MNEASNTWSIPHEKFQLSKTHVCVCSTFEIVYYTAQQLLSPNLKKCTDEFEVVFQNGLKREKTISNQEHCHIFQHKVIIFPAEKQGRKRKPTVKKPLSAPCACQCSVCRRQPALPPGPL